jgi:hypothetical protein
MRCRARRDLVRPLLALLALSVLSSGCVPQAYADVPRGTFSGDLDLRWLRSDEFLFMPNPAAPFTFVRANGDVLRPGRMVTDGGSVPRPLWAFEGYAPWTYAPAYILHDWMFQARHCGFLPRDTYSFDDTVAVFAEALKSLMEADPAVRDPMVYANLVTAAASRVALHHWDRGVCRSH